MALTPSAIEPECLDSIQLSYFSELRTQPDAQAACVALGGGSTLAVPIDQDVFGRIQTLYGENSGANRCWVGLVDENDPNKVATDPTRFVSIADNLPVDFIDVVGNPWRSNRPNNLDRDCVILSTSDLLLSDNPCEEEGGTAFLRDFVCGTPCTESPTESPTNFPTQSPTTFPTLFPTESPTAFPTNFPTESPTQFPTLFPTESPTNGPTRFPTTSPTLFPTNSPTENPTRFPTQSPTLFPTRSPTKSPTENPTESPTQFPTKNPTESPTQFPTESPVTGVPSLSPTKFPTEGENGFDDGFIAGAGLGFAVEVGIFIGILLCLILSCYILVCCFCKKPSEADDENNKPFEYSYKIDDDDKL